MSLVDTYRVISLVAGKRIGWLRASRMTQMNHITIDVGKTESEAFTHGSVF
jgi:hypothetical protein